MSDSDPANPEEEFEEVYDGEEPDWEPESEPEGYTSGSPTPEPKATTLEDAIRGASERKIRMLLTSVCRDNLDAARLVSSYLLQPIAHAPGLKRKAFEQCKHCETEYNVGDNAKGDCSYHTGKKELYDDDDCHGNRWDLFDDPDFEDGFRWTCCKKLSGEDGCVVSRHKPDVAASAHKRARR